MWVKSNSDRSLLWPHTWEFYSHCDWIKIGWLLGRSAKQMLLSVVQLLDRKGTDQCWDTISVGYSCLSVPRACVRWTWELRSHQDGPSPILCLYCMRPPQGKPESTRCGPDTKQWLLLHVTKFGVVCVQKPTTEMDSNCCHSSCSILLLFSSWQLGL